MSENIQIPQQPVEQPSAPSVPPTPSIQPVAKIQAQPIATFESEIPASSYQPTTGGMAQWIIKNSGGAVKNEKQAVLILAGFVTIMVLFSLYLIFSTSVVTKPPAPVMDPSYVPPTMNGNLNQTGSPAL